MQGKRTIQETFTGDGYSAHLGFKAMVDNPRSLSSGKGRMFMIDHVADSEGELHSRADGKYQLECSLQPILSHTFSNGVMGSQVLQCMLEYADMLRSGAITDIYGKTDEEAGL